MLVILSLSYKYLPFCYPGRFVPAVIGVIDRGRFEYAVTAAFVVSTIMMLVALHVRERMLPFL